MFEYLAKRFGGMLSKGDVFELFKLLERRYGTISKACEKIGIMRRTFYNWRNARQINVETKYKVLKVALEEHPIDTLEFLVRKSRGRTKEILEILIEILRREILIEEEPRRLENLVEKAREIINEYSIPIIEYLKHEVDGLAEAVYNKGYEISMASIISISPPSTILAARIIIPEPSGLPSSATTYQPTGISMEKPRKELQMTGFNPITSEGGFKWNIR